MGKKKSTMVLGYTRAGHPVLCPTHQVPDMAQFVSWTSGDHLDASRILTEHGERTADHEVGSWCAQWAGAHGALGKATRRRRFAAVRGAAEAAIRVGRKR